MSTFSWRVLRLPLLITLLWGLLLFTLFRWTAQREDEYTTGLARIQTATLFSSIVDTRDWNANNGGVWVREHPGCPANPWLPEEERTLRAEDGTTLVKVNPAYMTRQIAESFTSTLASFRISSLSPKRPENRADQWETGALLSFEKDRHELFDLVSDKEGMRYRYMAALPAKALATKSLKFATPSEVSKKFQPVGVLHSPYPISWADEERDVTAWIGNELQNEAFDKLYRLRDKIRAIDHPDFTYVWNFLQGSDHFYYMATKWFSDGDVHSYFNPYDSPYEAFINYMNVLSDFEIEVDKKYGEAIRAVPA